MNYPNTFNIFLTKRCNLGCRYCFVNKDSLKNKELDVISLRKAISLFLRFPEKNKTISFNGGEPLLRFGKIRKIYHYIQTESSKCNKLVVMATSNGTLLTESRYKFLKENKITLRISIDGKRETHDYNRPFKFKKYGSSYDRITDNLKKIYRSDKDDRGKINAQLVFAPSTVKNLVENIKFLCKLGFEYIDFYPDLYAQWSEAELDKLESKFKEFGDFYVSRFKNNKSGDNIFKNSLLYAFIKETQLYKPILCQKVHLDCRGNFYCCDKVFSIPESMRRKFVIGNINNGIDNRLRLKLIEQKRKEIKNLTGKDCRNCKYVKYCFCPVGHYIYFSSQGLNFKQYFPQFCRLSQIYIRSFLEIKNNLRPNPLFTRIYNS